MERFLKDGALYFAIIFGANLMNVVIFLFAVSDLKALGASSSQLITAVMISRLVLNLRTVSQGQADSGRTAGRSGEMAFAANQSYLSNFKNDTFVSRAIGDLGEELRDWSDDTTNSSDRSSSENFGHPKQSSTRSLEVIRLQPLVPNRHPDTIYPV
jgi:hypothetical protein